MLNPEFRTLNPLEYFRVALVLYLISLAGCSHDEVLGKVSGTVTFGNKPVAPGLIAFSNHEKGVNILAEIAADGSYRVMMAKGAGLPLGSYKVTVNPPLDDTPMGAPQPEGRRNQQIGIIPRRYRSLETSPLSLEVHEGENRYDVEMTP